jgi:hypothetical protein
MCLLFYTHTTNHIKIHKIPSRIRLKQHTSQTRTTTMATTSSSLRLLQAEVDNGEEDSYLRLLHNNKHVKYVTIAAGLYHSHDMCFEPVITALLELWLPQQGLGDWSSSLCGSRAEALPSYLYCVAPNYGGSSGHCPWRATRARCVRRHMSSIHFSTRRQIRLLGVGDRIHGG